MANNFKGAGAVMLWAAVIGATLVQPVRAIAQESNGCEPYCAPGRSWWPYHCACLHRRPPWNMEGYGAIAAGTVIQGFHVQAQNGTAIEMTLWNHNFEDDPAGLNGERSKPTERLHPSALALLHRAARRNAHQPGFLVLVQTAHDFEFTPDQLDGYAQAVDDLDAKRVRAVKEYLTKVLRRPDARVALHDPPIVGMSTVEMRAAYDNMIKYGPRSVLETIDPEIRPLGSYAAPPGYIFGERGLIPIGPEPGGGGRD